MIVRSSIRRTHHPFFAGILLLVSLATACPARAQQTSPNSIGIWEPSEAKMQPMLAKPPSKEADRYARLRQYFTTFGCTGDRLSEVLLEEMSHHPALVCTLPGASERKVLVLSHYPRHEVFDGASDSWPDAAMLPMLYHSLQAQPRQLTFVFVELDNEPHALANLLTRLRSAGSTPVALIDVAQQGFGAPGFTTPPEDYPPPRLRPNAQTVRVEAWRVLQVQHIDISRTNVDSPFTSTPTADPSANANAPRGLGIVPSLVFLPEGARDVPSIRIYSQPIVHPGQYVAFSLPAFRQDYEYIAFYLADLDTKLDGSL